jgi:hypothetical protein
MVSVMTVRARPAEQPIYLRVADELERAIEPQSKTVSLRARRPPERVRDALALGRAGEALFFGARADVDGERGAYAETWLAADLVPDLAEMLGSGGSLYAAFERRYRLRPARGASRAELAVGSAAVAHKLRMDGRPMLFRLDGRTDSLRARRPLEVTTSWLRADISASSSRSSGAARDRTSSLRALALAPFAELAQAASAPPDLPPFTHPRSANPVSRWCAGTRAEFVTVVRSGKR